MVGHCGFRLWVARGETGGECGAPGNRDYLYSCWLRAKWRGLKPARAWPRWAGNGNIDSLLLETRDLAWHVGAPWQAIPGAQPRLAATCRERGQKDLRRPTGTTSASRCEVRGSIAGAARFLASRICRAARRTASIVGRNKQQLREAEGALLTCSSVVRPNTTAIGPGHADPASVSLAAVGKPLGRRRLCEGDGKDSDALAKRANGSRPPGRRPRQNPSFIRSIKTRAFNSSSPIYKGKEVRQVFSIGSWRIRIDAV